MSSKTRTSTVEIRGLYLAFTLQLPFQPLPRLAFSNNATFLYKTLRKRRAGHETHKKRAQPCAKDCTRFNFYY